MEPMQRVSQYPGGEVGVTPGETPPGVDTMYLYHSNTLIFALYIYFIEVLSAHFIPLIFLLFFISCILSFDRINCFTQTMVGLHPRVARPSTHKQIVNFTIKNIT